jgi:hypothetical protein
VRVTREKLVDLAREEAERRGQIEDVLSGYLIGSVASGDPIIGGSADIDLVLIHRYKPDRHREIVPLSNDIHLDITHYSSEVYQYPPDLRIDPWIGPSMCEPIFLYDPDHFFERAQAGVRGQFFRLDHTHTRALAFLTRAREAKPEITSDPAWVTHYLNSAMDAANALATLGGFPIAGRRMSILLKSRFLELDLEKCWYEFQNLLVSNQLHEELIAGWIDAWEVAYDAASHHDPIFNPVRKNYYLKSFLSFIDMGITNEIFWLLITTWSSAVQVLFDVHSDDQYYSVWESALKHFNLSSHDRGLRADELENFLDHVEEILENWA